MNTRILAAVAVPLFLTACGGGDDGGPVSSSDGGDSSDGSAPLEISSLEVTARLSTILASSDTLLMTDWHDTEFALGGGNILTNCRAGACQTPIEGVTFEITLDDLTVDDDTEYQAVVTRNGITLFVGRTEITEIEDADGITAEGAGYGAWLDYSGFETSAALLIGDVDFIEFVAGYSAGNDSGSGPVGGSATWTGAMTGADLGFNHFVVGDAAVTVDFATTNAGVAFTNITDLNTLSDLPSMEWSGLAIGADGRFGASDIKATFYGPNHEEVGGIFQRNEIVGAFGAKRQ